jgi:hypothetical protein
MLRNSCTPYLKSDGEKRLVPCDAVDAVATRQGPLLYHSKVWTNAPAADGVAVDGEGVVERLVDLVRDRVCVRRKADLLAEPRRGPRRLDAGAK